MLRDIKNFFINIWNFRRFLWNNHWWDSYYIFYMLREKLIVDIRYYKTKGMHLNVSDDIRKMELCVKLLNRIIKDEYFLSCSRNTDRQQRQDIDYLFKFMSKHILAWWD